MELNFLLVIIGLIICFGGIYLKKFCAGITGLIWGAFLGLVIVAMSALSSGGFLSLMYNIEDESNIPIIVVAAIVVCILSVLFDRICVFINTLLSGFLIVFMLAFIIVQDMDYIFGVFAVALLISLSLAIVAYIYYKYAYVILAAFSGAFIAGIGGLGLVYDIEVYDVLYSIVLGADGELLTIALVSTLVLGVLGCFVQTRYFNRADKVKENKIMTVIGMCVSIIVLGLVIFVGVNFKGESNISEGNGEVYDVENPGYNTETQRQVIDILGMTYDEAKWALNNMNLGIFLDGSEESDGYEAGQIMWQSCEEGEIVDINTTIHVKTSLGNSEYKELPSVIGLSVEETAKVLKDYDLSAKEVAYEYSDTVEVGCVISQVPEAGTVLSPSTEYVELIISRGTKSRSAKVPNVKGVSKEDAMDSLDREGFKVVVVEAHSNSMEAGYVISQNYEPETVLAEGASVTITVSLGK